MIDTDLIIVGAGAAGLMAAATAGEAGLKAVVMERRHRPGLKLLLCGNNRCNITQDAPTDDMLAAYGEPVADFLQPAMDAFPPRTLRRWFDACGLPTVVHDDGRVFPRSERADDVLHCFTDRLRDLSVPLMLNTAVERIERRDGAFVAIGRRVAVHASRMLLATGGVSYPKTGSVGDGQKFAKSLGHRIEPYRPGLAGIDLGLPWLQRSQDIRFPETRVTLLVQERPVAETTGEILCSKQCARGPAMVNASRIIGRRQLRETIFEIDLFPNRSRENLIATLARAFHESGRNWPKALADEFLDRRIAPDLFGHVIQPRCQGECSPDQVARILKGWRVNPAGTRPLKEAMVTIGGVRLEEIDPYTMASRRCPNLYFAGEVMDVDGPTGGYNLHAAFASARLALEAVARECGRTVPGVPEPSRSRRGRAKKNRRHKRR